MDRHSRDMARWLAVLCVAGALAIGALAPPTAHADDYAYLSGFVHAEAGGGAIAGAQIEVTTEYCQPCTYTSYLDGSYQVYLPIPSGMTSAMYEVSFKAFGFATGTLTVTVQPETSPRRNIRLTSLPRFSLSGIVRDADDLTPIAGAAVSLSGTPVDTQYTDRTGAFNFPDVPAGRYDVEAAGFCRKPRNKTVVVTNQNETTELRLHAGADAFGYACAEEPFDWVDGVSTVNPTYPSTRVALPFPVYFYGQRETTVHLSSVGVAAFTPGYASYVNQPIPVPYGPLGALFPFWDDLYFGAWKIATIGTAPDRTFVVEFENFVRLRGLLADQLRDPDPRARQQHRLPVSRRNGLGRRPLGDDRHPELRRQRRVPGRLREPDRA